MKKQLLTILLGLSLSSLAWATASQTLQVKNGGEQTLIFGATPVSFAWNSGSSGVLPMINQGDCANASLAHNATCTFSLTAQSNPDITSTQIGIATVTSTNSPAVTYQLTVAVAPTPSCSINVGNYEWSRDANLGLLANAAGVPGVNAQGGMSIATAEGAFLTWLNTENYCGHSDWGLPTVEQFGCDNTNAGECIVNEDGIGLLSGWSSGTPLAYLEALGFTNIVSGYYRSGEIAAQYGFPWVLDMSSGVLQTGVGPNNQFPVLPVRIE